MNTIEENNRIDKLRNVLKGLEEAINDFLGCEYIEVNQDSENFNSDLFAQYEAINFNSKMLIDLLNH
jgi:hypothetical protein